MDERFVRIDLYFEGKLLKPGAIVKMKNSYGVYRFVGLYYDMLSQKERVWCMSLKDRVNIAFHPGDLHKVVGKRSRRGKD